MWFADQALLHTPLFADITFRGLHHRHRALLGPYLRCAFATQHQFVCDTIVTVSGNSLLGKTQSSTACIVSSNNVISDKQTNATFDSKNQTKESVIFEKKKIYDCDYDTRLHSNGKNKCHDSTSHHAETSDLHRFILSPLLLFTSTLTSLLFYLFLRLAKFGEAVATTWQKSYHHKRLCLLMLTHPYLLLTYLTFVAYWPSLWAELVFDDRPAILENQDLYSTSPWIQLFFNDYWGTPLKSPLSHKSYRPITVATFRVNFLLHRLHPFGYHLINLILHAIVCCLFYRLCLLFFNEQPTTPACNKSSSNNNSHDSEQPILDCKQNFSIRPEIPCECGIEKTPRLCTVSFFTSLIFCTHPIHTDCVSSVVGRAEILSAIFYLSAILLWVQVTTGRRLSANTRTTLNVETRRHAERSNRFQLLLKQYKWKFTSIAVTMIGFLCKEQSLMVLLYLCVFELCRIETNAYCNDSALRNSVDCGDSNVATTVDVRHRPHLSKQWRMTYSLPIPHHLHPARRRQQHHTFIFSERAANICFLLLCFSAALVVRLTIMNYMLPTFNRFDNLASRSDFPVKHLTYAYLAAYHFWLLIFPNSLSCDWTHSSIELIDFRNGIFSIDLLRALIPVLSLLLLGWFLLLLVASLISPQPLSFRSSFPTIGRFSDFLSFVTNLNANIERKLPCEDMQRRKLILHAIALTLIPFVPASNLFFPIGYVIAERILYIPSVGLGLLLGIGARQLIAKWKVDQQSNKQNNNKAHPVYWMLVALVVVFAIKTHLRSFDWSNEHRLYRSGLAVNPTNTKLMNNLGRLYEKENCFDKAIDLYQQAIRIESRDIRSHLNLGNALLAKKEVKSAENAYRQALQQVESELFTPSQGKNAPLSPNSLTLSPLYLTALVRLAELLHLDESRSRELEQIKLKMEKINSLIHQTSADNLEAFRSSSITAKKAGTKLVTPSCGVNCNSGIDRSFEVNNLYNMAIVHYRQGEPQQALEYFERALTLNPDHEDSLLASVQIIHEEDIDRLHGVARARLRQLVQLGKGDATVHFNLAMLAAKENDLTQARHYFEQAIFLESSFAEAHYNLALIFIKELDQTNDWSGDEQIRARNIAYAIDHLKTVLSINAKHVKSMLALGDLYAEHLSQVDTARLYYQMAVDLGGRTPTTGNLRARNNLCVLWHRQSNFEQAIRCFEQLKRDLQRSSATNDDNDHVDSDYYDHRQPLISSASVTATVLAQIDSQIETLLEAERNYRYSLRKRQICKNASQNVDATKVAPPIDKFRFHSNKYNQPSMTRFVSSQFTAMCLT